jgi:hypothetical protein
MVPLKETRQYRVVVQIEFAKYQNFKRGTPSSCGRFCEFNHEVSRNPAGSRLSFWRASKLDSSKKVSAV